MVFSMKMIFFSFHCRVIREQCRFLWKEETRVPGEKSLEQGKDHQQTWHVHHQRTLKSASTIFDAIKIIVSIIHVICMVRRNLNHALL